MRRLAIVGRPNVGKSTLFNRLARRRLAIVDDRPGVTRDRRETETEIGGHPYLLIDTAGFEDATDESLEARMRAQTEAAITDAAHVLFVIDARAGVTPVDQTFAALLRRKGATVTVLANKCEGKAAESGLLDAYSLGFGEPIAFSAEHGLGLGDLEVALDEAFADEIVTPEPDDDLDLDAGSDGEFEFKGPIRIAVCRSPECGEIDPHQSFDWQRAPADRPGGRDHTRCDHRRLHARRSPGAACRYGGPAQEGADHGPARKDVGRRYDQHDPIRHIVILIVDIKQPLEKQDLQIADLVVREGRALMIAVNKVDAVTNLEAHRASIREMVERLLPQVRGVPLHFISAKSGRGIDRMIGHALKTFDIWNRHIPTSALNSWLADTVSRHPPPAPGGRRIKIRFLTQPKTRPPTFVAFSQRAEALPTSYKRYLVNGLRETFELTGVPLRLLFRAGDNPYVGKKKK